MKTPEIFGKYLKKKTILLLRVISRRVKKSSFDFFQFLNRFPILLFVFKLIRIKIKLFNYFFLHLVSYKLVSYDKKNCHFIFFFP